jgi:hypothetical protein
MKTQHTYCDKIQEFILLEESDGLNPEQAGELSKHLDQCPDCARYKSDYMTLMSASRTALPDGIPSEKTMQNILAHAEKREGKIVHFTGAWRAIASIAAVLAVIFGTYVSLYSPDPGPQTQGYGIGDMQTMVSFASDGVIAEPSGDGVVGDEAHQLRELADQLLQLQGFTIEEKIETEDITDLFLPTALQSRSTREFPAGTSV